MDDMTKKLEEEVKASLVDDKLPCAVAFKIAEKLNVPKKQVGDTANKLDIKIAHCQLGCFP
jgi:putative aminopeptidase FrvX